MLKSYTVTVLRIRVKASNPKQAENIALSVAGDYKYSEYDADYEAICMEEE